MVMFAYWEIYYTPFISGIRKSKVLNARNYIVIVVEIEQKFYVETYQWI